MADKRLYLMDLVGGRGWNRTTNLSIKSRMLCQLSYASGRRSAYAGDTCGCEVLLLNQHK